MVQYVLILLVFFLAGCRFPSEIPEEQTPKPPPTPLICTPLPETMTFVVTPLSHTSLHIGMTGLQPGEIPIVNVRAQTPDGSIDMTVTQTKPVDSTGQYDIIVSNLELDSTRPPYWHVIVTHSQGVACETVRLP